MTDIYRILPPDEGPLMADFCLSPPTAMGCGFNRSTQQIGHTPIVLGYAGELAGKHRSCWLQRSTVEACINA